MLMCISYYIYLLLYNNNHNNNPLLQAVTRFNAQVHPLESTTAEAVLACPPLQRALSKKLDNHAFQSLLSSSSQVNKARILSVSAPHAGSWISATPSTGLDLHLDSAECQVALRWWLGHDTSGGSPCPLCPDTALDPQVTMQPLADMVVMWLHGTTACEISLPSSAVGPTFLCRSK